MIFINYCKICRKAKDIKTCANCKFKRENQHGKKSSRDVQRRIE